jgi:tRNA A-37 threonylcarbamoyl transferase component Bud32/dipeptidyl aminopeptidase/acylaminoacyl peptidase
MTLTTGTSLGPYEVIAPLGAGGMGEVYRARDPRLGREVAIKVLPEDLADNPSRLGRFEREAKATGALNHPHILAIHDIGEHQRRPYVVYELLEGQTLGERMREGSLPLNEALTWAMQVAQGLAAAHAKGIVHRDLKPENLFLTKAGPLKILDFGLAKVARAEIDSDASIDPEDLTAAHESLTAEGAVLGTVGYMSPEQVKGERADHRSDIFSLGVVLYEMLSGRRPFRGRTAPETMAAILKEDPPALPEEEVSPPIAEVVGRCLEKGPEARFQSAHDLALALEVLATSVADTSPAIAALAPTRTPVHWGRRLLLVAGALVVVAGLVLALRHLVTPAGPPRLENLTRITPSGFAGGGLATDGQRLYYTARGRLFQMPATGGPAVEIQPWGEERVYIEGVLVSLADPTQLMVGRYDGPGMPEPVGAPVSLWTLTLPAATPRLLAEEAIYAGVAWSPGGKRTAVGRGPEIHVIDQEAGSSRKVLSAETGVWVMEWSADDRITYILWSVGTDGFRMEPWQMSSDGSDPHPLVPDWPGTSFVWPRWTPDGRYVIFASGAGVFSGEIFALEAGATEPVPLATGVDCGGLRLDPEGRRLYASCLSMRSEPFVYRPEVREWAPHEFVPDSSPKQMAWSPDGEWVAWIRHPEGTLWRSRTDGTQKLRLTEPGELAVTMPRWSPDGEQLSFNRSTPEGVPLRGFVVSRDGQGLRPVTEDEYMQDTTAWSEDGRVVVSSMSEEGALRVVDLETGEWEELAGTEGYIGVNSSPDGRLLVAHEWEGVPGTLGVLPGQVHLFDWETREWRPLPIPHGGMLSWSADGRFLYHFCGEAEGYAMGTYCRLDLDTGETEAVAEASNLTDVNFWVSVEPHGRIIGQRALTSYDIHVWDLVLP